MAKHHPDPAAGGRLHWRLSVADPSRVGAVVDLDVEVPPGCPAGLVRPALLAAVGADPAAGLAVAGSVVADHLRVGYPPLLDGVLLTVAADRPRPATVAVPGAGEARVGGEPLAVLAVVSGPDAGGSMALTAGSSTVGRAAGCTLVVADGALSRVHLEVRVAEGRVLVRDAGSTNGSTLDGEPLGATWQRLAVGARLGAGASELAMVSPGTPASTTPDGRGHLVVNRAPRLPGPPGLTVVEYPDQGAPLSPLRLPWASLLVPALLAVPLAFILRQPSYLLLAGLSPLAALAQHLLERRRRRRDQDRNDRDLRAVREEADAALRRALEAESRQRFATSPGPAEIAAAAAQPSIRLWERRLASDDALVVRIGRAAQEAEQVRVHRSGAPATAATLGPVPVRLDLRAEGVVGVCGPREAVLAAARAVVGQLAVLHSPRELRICVAVADDARLPDWAWAAWLPHTGDLLPTPAASASRTKAGEGETPATVLVLDGAARLRTDPRLAALLTCRPAPGAGAASVSVLCLDETVSRLPVECSARLELSGTGEARLDALDRAGLTLTPDGAGARWADRLARTLAPARDATPEPVQPTALGPVDLLDLVREHEGVDPLDSDALARLWRRRASSTAVPLGRSAVGIWVPDLRRDGPHLLVAGTTGSGKSELLLGLVAGLAALNRPDRLALLLLDFKGGTGLGRLAALPQVLDVVTDLDARAARRAVDWLGAEVRRRERLLRTLGLADHTAYEQRAQAQGDPSPPPLPRLVVVVDEFRVLAQEQPAALGRLVHLAAVGRSLGVHLVLCTQRPAGVVSADIRANVDLRICLRVQDATESLDVLDAADAAQLPPQSPGAAVVRGAGDRLLAVQLARVTRPAPAGTGRSVGPDAVRVVRLGRCAPNASRHEAVGPRACAPPAQTPRAGSADALDLLVRAVAHAAHLDGVDDELTGRAAGGVAGGTGVPWVGPLPARVPVPGPAAAGVSSASRTRLRFALADDVARQRHATVAWDLTQHGHLAVIGGPRSGRTATLRTLAVAAADLAAAAESSDPTLDGGPAVHVHVLDANGGLAGLPALPVVGTVVPVTDLERTHRLVRLLQAEVAARRCAVPGSTAAHPALLLLVDGWERVVEASAALDRGRLVDDLVTLVRDGAGVGLRLAVTGGRSLLSGPIAGLTTVRLLLSADPTDLLLAGVRPSALAGAPAPGRGLWQGPPSSWQPCPGDEGEADPDQPLDVQVLWADDATVTARAGRVPPGGPVRLVALPWPVRSAAGQGRDRPGGRGDASDPAGLVVTGGVRRVPVGVGGDDAGPLWLDLSRSPGALVLGRPGSGRSTTLATLGRAFLAAGEPVTVLPNDGRVAALLDEGARCWPWDGRGVLLVDDVGPGLPEEAEILGLLGGGAGSAADRHRAQPGMGAGAGAGPGPRSGVVLAAYEPAEAAVSIRGLAATLRRARTGLLLAPQSVADGEAFGLRTTPLMPAPPGRGFLVQSGRAELVQVALSDPDPPDVQG